jgi:ATP-binding cassette, subfamily B, bacterial
LREVPAAERARRIGFILQEPVLFSGTVRDNILYGNDAYATLDDTQLLAELEKSGLAALLQRFDGGLQAKVAGGGDSLSLGQKQLIAFMRSALRQPDLLILDEATANIDTVTEQLLESILRKLPAHTTRVIIAHRLNTIENADEIFFVNGAELTRAESMEAAVDLLLHRQKSS